MSFLQYEAKPETAPIEITMDEFNVLTHADSSVRKMNSKHYMSTEKLTEITRGLRERGIDVHISSNGYESMIKVRPESKKVCSAAVVNFYKKNKG